MSNKANSQTRRRLVVAACLVIVSASAVLLATLWSPDRDDTVAQQTGDKARAEHHAEEPVPLKAETPQPPENGLEETREQTAEAAVRAPESEEEKEVVAFLEGFMDGDEITEIHLTGEAWKHLLATHEKLMAEHKRVNQEYANVVSAVGNDYVARNQCQIFEKAPSEAETRPKYPGERVIHRLQADGTYIIRIPPGAEPRLEQAWQAKDDIEPIMRAAYAQFLQQHTRR